MNASQRKVMLYSMAELEVLAKNSSWLIKNLIPDDAIGMFFGASGTYKSFIAIDAALHVAHGLKWCGARTQRGLVLFIAAEGGGGIYRRIVAWHREYGLDLTDNILLCTKPLVLSAEHDAKNLKDEIDQLSQKPALIIIDTLSQTFEGEENSSADTSAYIRNINLYLRAPYNCSVVIIHHTGHNATDRPRGSSALTANLDFVYGIYAPTEDGLVARFSSIKMKDSEPQPDQHFALKRMVLWKDEDGDDVTTLVANRCDAASIEAYKARKPDELVMEQIQCAIFETQDDSRWRGSDQTGEAWVGNIIAKEAGLDLGRAGDKGQVKSMLTYMLKEGFLNIVQKPYGSKGKTAPFVEIGRWLDTEIDDCSDL